MTVVIYLALCIISACLSAYTQAFQGATLYWGKLLAPTNPLLPRGMQDAITPASQNVRNITSWLMHLGLLIGGFFYFRWYFVLGVFVLALLLSFFIYILIIPASNSSYFLQRILSSLKRRKARYLSADDRVRVFVLEDIIDRLTRMHSSVNQEEN